MVPQDAHKGRRAAFSGLETKKRRASGGARPGAAEAKASGDPWLTPQALHKGEGGPNSAKRNQPARGGRARRGISQGREPRGISRRAGRKGGNFPEYGNDRPTDRPRRHGSPEGGSAFKPRQAKLAGLGLLEAGVAACGGGDKADQAGISRTTSPGILAPGA